MGWVFFGFKGRLGPKAFFLAGLLVFITQVWLSARYLAELPGSPEGNFWSALFTLFAPVSIWSNCALTAKRFHDFGRPGVLAAISLLIGFLLVIALAFIRSDPGPNAYGERPDEPG